jgi:hypothetical protein
MNHVSGLLLIYTLQVIMAIAVTIDIPVTVNLTDQNSAEECNSATGELRNRIWPIN